MKGNQLILSFSILVYVLGIALGVFIGLVLIALEILLPCFKVKQ